MTTIYNVGTIVGLYIVKHFYTFVQKCAADRQGMKLDMLLNLVKVNILFLLLINFVYNITPLV